jgi:transcriptional regulator with XRE-family HTH domain
MKKKATANLKLEAARLNKRWSVDVACKKIGVSVNTFNRWERGLQLPQLETLDQLCKAFDMSPEELGFEDVITAKRRAKPPGPKKALPADPFLDEEFPAPSAAQDTSDFPSQQVSNEFTLHVEQIKKTLDEMKQVQDALEEKDPKVSRKQAVALLVSAPSAVFDLAKDTKELLLYSDEILSLSTVSLPLCWQLYYEGGFSELYRLLPGYITQLSALAQQQSSLYYRQAAYLASQVHQLGYLLALQRQDFGTSLKHTQEALRYGQMAEDIDLQVTSLVRKAYVYFCLHRHRQRLLTYQDALHLLCNHCSPLLRGYVYAGLAETYASQRNEAMAYEFLKRAQEHYPEHPEADPVYSYTHFRWPTFHNFAGQVYLHLNKPKQAWEAFATVDKLVPTVEEPYRVELIVHQTATALALGEQEQSCALIEKAVNAARSLGSNLRYDEAYMIYEQMQEKWEQEPRVQTLAELFH